MPVESKQEPKIGPASEFKAEPKSEAKTGTKPEPKPSVAASPGTVVGNATFIEGGLGVVRGIRCAGVSAGFRRNPARKDLALVVADKPAVAAGVFTRNVFCAAPVMVSREHLARQLWVAGAEAGAHESAQVGTAAGEVAEAGAHAGTQARITAGEAAGTQAGTRAIVLNSGNANASNGERGMATAQATAAIAAEHLGCEPFQVLVASTGVIGVPLDEDTFVTGIPLALAALGAADGTAADAGLAAAQAIMTTDTHPKQAAVTFCAKGDDGAEVTYTIGGMVKGSGMIQPNMATLLGVLATDAWLTQEALDCALRRVMDVTLNKVTVDSDTSTNDAVYLLSTGANKTAEEIREPTSPLFEPFVSALTALCEDLARQIAYDGEGATRLVTINLSGAANDADADAAGRAIANSPLVKTAIAGHDANWGRIAMAVGKSGVAFRQEDARITIMGLPVYRDGLPVPFDEDEALRLFDENTEIVIDVDLGAGAARTRLWTCDLTHEYIAINGDYRS
jgi:glutamate N-acetyltransferase/amino-acid N-acetyltransferase